MNKKIILALHQFFPVFFTGTETLVLNVAHGLRNIGYEVIILTAEPILDQSIVINEACIKEDFYEGFKVLRLYIPNSSNDKERLIRESKDFLLKDLFKEVLEYEKPAYIHIFHLMRLTSTLIDVAQKEKIPLFFTPTDFWMLCPTYQLIKSNNDLCNGPSSRDCFSCLFSLNTKHLEKIHFMYKIAINFPLVSGIFSSKVREVQNILSNRIKIHKDVMKIFQFVFWPNIFIQDIFSKNNLVSRKSKVVSFPLPSKSNNIFDINKIVIKDKIIISFIGTLRESKGPQVLIKAIKNVPKEYNIEVNVYGESIENEFMEYLIKLTDFDSRIIFKGIFKQEEFANVLENTHIVVIPSIWYENTPLTALSVLAARRVLVVSNLGGLASLIKDGEDGFLFDANNHLHLAKILIKLIENHSMVYQIVNNIKSPNSTSKYIEELVKQYERPILNER